jgi:hypothetical protein
MVNKTDAIKRFLLASTHSDLANLYGYGMECQVNVAQDGGQRIEGEFQGRKWRGWTDGLTTWKPFRIPRNAATFPEYSDSPMAFDLAEHVEAIGMTGWNWQEKVSKWVAFDFDALIGHSEKTKKKLTEDQLQAVKEAACQIPWVTVRKSTSGTGLHLYVFLDDVPTENHNEHAALGRAILGTMSALTTFDFQNHVDICGGNMWVWHRKMRGTNGLTLIKQGETFYDIPKNWKDHVKVVSGQRRKNLPQNIDKIGLTDTFEELAGQYPKIPLDDEHKRLIDYLSKENFLWWWDQDHHALVTHTICLKRAHEALSLKGIFDTNSPASNLNEQNCFGFPLRKGAWAIRRFTPGVQEHACWEQDGAGWTRCYLNRAPTFASACRSFDGIEDPSGGFIFRDAESAIQAAQCLGVHLNIGTPQRGRETKLNLHKDGRLIAEIEYKPTDRIEEMNGWLPKKNKIWTKIYNIQTASPTESEYPTYDDMVRHLVTTTNEDYGWMIKTDNIWRLEPLAHVRVALGAMGLGSKEITNVLGSSIFKCWSIVNKPFQPEYPGDREWNRNAARLRFTPSQYNENLYYPHWSKIVNHCGKGLDEAVKRNGWCKANGILTGGDYLKCWIASLFKEPHEPLPYLFFYSLQQGTGKSIFHESLSLLLTRGYQRADAALISQAGFNAELEGAILCVVEETDLRKNQQAYNRIKDWVTSRDLLIHCKGKTPYHIPNTTHWIQCSNNHQSCPIFQGDTRITMSYVEPLDPLELIPKKRLMPLLEKEASDFLSALLHLDLPPSNDRLNIPVIETEDKLMLQKLNETPLERFLTDETIIKNGQKLKFSEFYDRFQESLDITEQQAWSKIRTRRELPTSYPYGRERGTGQFYIGNLAWKDNTEEFGPRYVLKDGYLEQE